MLARWKGILLALLVISFWPDLCAQEPREVSGRVWDAGTGQPLSQVNLRSVRTGQITLTDTAGRFRIRVILPDTLECTHVAYSHLRLPLHTGTRFPLSVMLAAESQHLDEVVISDGYQQIAKERVTGSIVQVDNELFNRSAGQDVLSRLEGVTGGLLTDMRTKGPDNTVVEPRNIVIRGVMTITESIKAPLIVLDNFPYEGDLNSINPNDIEDVVVLRDAAASSIWGARAGNGVIVISTKKGKKHQRARLSVNLNSSFTEKPDLFHYPQMSVASYIEVERFLFEQGFYNSSLNNQKSNIVKPVTQLLAEARDGNITMEEAEAGIAEFARNDLRHDLRRYTQRTGVHNQAAVSLSGGGNFMSYYISGGYDRRNEVLRGNGGDRKSLQLQVRVEPLKNLEFQTQVLFSSSSLEFNSPVNLTGMPLVAASNGQDLYPYARLADDEGKPLEVPYRFGYRFLDTVGGGRLLDWRFRPLQEIDARDQTSTTQTFLVNLGLRYRISPAFYLDLKGQVQNQHALSRTHHSLETYHTRDLVNSYTQIDGEQIRYIVPMAGILSQAYRRGPANALRGQMGYRKTFRGTHHLDIIAGGEIRESISRSESAVYYGYDHNILSVARMDYVNNYPLMGNRGTSSIPGTVSVQLLRDRYISGFANISWILHNKYIFTASARKDASNLFGVSTNNRGKPFWSAGLAWNLHQEEFYRSDAIPWIQLKLSYGYNGNVNNSLNAVTVLRTVSAGVSRINEPSADILQPADKSLTWESIRTINAGLSFRTAGERLSGSIEGYWKFTYNMIARTSYDPTTGLGSASNPRRNLGNMRGDGLDIQLNGKVLTGKLGWTIRAMLSYSQFKITWLDTMASIKMDSKVGTSSAVLGDGTKIPEITGFAPYGLYSYRYGGLDPQTGAPIGFLNGEASTNHSAIRSNTLYSEMIYHGPALAPWFGSLFHDFSYKGLRLSVNIQFKFGYYFRKSTISYYDLYRNGKVHGDFERRWQEPGDEAHTDIPAQYYPAANNHRDQFYANSEATARKGDHIRLRDLRLSYHLQPGHGHVFKPKLEIFAMATNLGLIWTDNPEKLDPDYNATGILLPPMKTLSAGIRMEF